MKYTNILFILSFATVSASSEGVSSFPSYQGFRGIINTPSAEIVSEGDFEFLYSNQVDNLEPTESPDFREEREQKNYFLNIGVLPNLDLSLRYAYGKELNSDSLYLSDRILSLKYQLPFVPDNIASVALGIQDIGGGVPHLNSKYLVSSKTFQNFRTSLGYAKGDDNGALNGIFGGVEYQPFSWLYLATEYDTKEWNMALKTAYTTKIGEQPLSVGVMAKSSVDYNDAYYGFFTKFPLYDKASPIIKEIQSLPLSKISQLQKLGLNNITYKIQNNTIYLSYENTLYTWNDIDALGMVLGIIATSNIADNIEVIVKKSNIDYQTVKTKTKEYKAFLKTGNYRPHLLIFSDKTESNTQIYNSDQFKPLLTLSPEFSLIDGSEYGHMDYSLALQAEASLRLAKGTILSTRLNVPINETDNFKKDYVFDYRTRNLGEKIEMDQLLLSQYVQINIPIPWINLFQIGQFEKDLTGFSYESAISNSNGEHQFMLKVANMQDDIYEDMDWYHNTDKREERLLSYRYYWDKLDSNIKLTVGQFLYGDEGINLSLKRNFSDIQLQLDLAQTDHELRGESKIGKLMLSMPFGLQKRIKTTYLDLQGGDLTYKRRKTLVSEGKISYVKPFHTKEVANSFTLEKYYMDKERFQPSYIQNNFDRLRNIFLKDIKTYKSY